MRKSSLPRIILLCLLTSCLSAFALAQSVVKGKITDQSTGEAIQGVNISVKGTNDGTMSDAGGNYSITVSSTSATLVFSFTGYATQEVAIAGKSEINVVLATAAASLSEVVVVGYGTQQKKDVTGAVASVKGSEIQNLPVSGATQALQGRTAGVNVVRNGGTPGSGGNIRIRGTGTINNADPLTIIDGVPAGDLNSVNPNDIESIEILKDASASAIYGTRAANGVVIITTKRGNFEQPSRVSVNAYTGSSNVIKTLDMLDAGTMVELKRERYTNDGLTINEVWNNPDNQVQRTNWQDALFKAGKVTNVDVSLAGGGARSSYLISGGYYDEKGVITNSFYNRLSLRINSDHKVGKRLKIGQSLQLTRSNENGLGTTPGNLSAQSGIIWSAIRFMPFIPVRNVDGSWGSSKASNEYGDINNPVFTAETTDADFYKTRLLGNLTAEYEIFKGLKLKANVGLDARREDGRSFSIIVTDQTRTTNNNSLNKSTLESYSLLGEYFLNYNKIFGKHKLDAVAGYTAQSFNADWFSASKRDFINEADNQRYLDVGQTLAGIGGSRGYDALASWFGRVNYDFDQRYLLTATLRSDGSSKFAAGNKWGYFPAFSAGWRISQEKFFENNRFFDELKLTAGWGQLGNQEVGGLQYLALIGGGHRYSFGDNTVVGSAQTRIPNYNISWETAEMTNIGLSAEVLDRTLQANINYFVKTTRDMLLAPPVVGTLGTAGIPNQNVGTMRNQGLEVDLTYRNKAGKLNYSFSGNAAFIKNKVVKLYDGNFVGSSFYGRPQQEISRTYEGQPLAVFYGWKTDGLYQTQDEIDRDANIANDDRRTAGLIQPGDTRFLDLNNDGQITEADRTVLGSPHAKVVYGFNANFEYSGFDLNLFFLGNAGLSIFNADRMQGLDPTYSFNMYAETENRWTGAGTSNTIPRMTTLRNNLNHRTSDMFIEKGDFFRLKNVVLGYTFPNRLTQKAGISRARIYVTGQNLFVFTKYSGLDPELGYANDGNRQINVDYAQYPQSRSFTFGVNLTF